MSKKSEPLGVRSKAKPSRWPAVLRLLLGVVVTSLAFLFVLGPPHFTSTFLARGALAGLAGGLLFGRRDWLRAVGVTTAGAVAASFLLFTPGLVSPFSLVLAAVVLPSVVSGAVARFVPEWPQWPRMILVAIALSLTLAWSFGVVGGPMKVPLSQTRARVSTVPQPEKYEGDPFIYIKTVDYMREGLPYYSAFQKAWAEDTRLQGTIPGALNFREPLLFELWRYLPGAPAGSAILNAYLLLSWFGVMLCWLTARRFVSDGVAMLSGQLLIPVYAGMAFVGQWFMMPEVWAAVLVLGAFCLLVRGRYMSSVAAIIAAVAVRELAIVYVPAWALVWYFGGDRRRWLPGLLVVVSAPLAVLGVHLAIAPAEQSTSIASAVTWLNSSGLARAINAVRFGGMSPWANLVLPAVAGLSVVGAGLIRAPWLRFSMLWSAVAPIIFLTLFSSGAYDYYWGLIFQPLLVTLAAVTLVRVFPSPEPAAS